MGMGAPFALDFGAVMLVGQARSVDIEMLAEVLPDAERAILSPPAGPSGYEGSDDGQ